MPRTRSSFADQRRMWKLQAEQNEREWRRKEAAEAGKQAVYHFKTAEAAALFVNEVQGQLSDGMWENAKPIFHWMFWCKGKTVLDGKVGYTYKDFPPQDFRNRYNVTSLITSGIKIIEKRMKGCAAVAQTFGFDEEEWKENGYKDQTHYFEDLDAVSELTGMTVEEIEKIKLRKFCQEINDMFHTKLN